MGSGILVSNPLSSPIVGATRRERGQGSGLEEVKRWNVHIELVHHATLEDCFSFLCNRIHSIIGRNMGCEIAGNHAQRKP